MLYDVVRADDPNDFVIDAVCIETDDGPNTEATDAEILPPGVLGFYQVRAENTCVSRYSAYGLPETASTTAPKTM